MALTCVPIRGVPGHCLSSGIPTFLKQQPLHVSRDMVTCPRPHEQVDSAPLLVSRVCHPSPPLDAAQPAGPNRDVTSSRKAPRALPSLCPSLLPITPAPQCPAAALLLGCLSVRIRLWMAEGRDPCQHRRGCAGLSNTGRSKHKACFRHAWSGAQTVS